MSSKRAALSSSSSDSSDSDSENPSGLDIMDLDDIVAPFKKCISEQLAQSDAACRENANNAAKKHLGTEQLTETQETITELACQWFQYNGGTVTGNAMSSVVNAKNESVKKTDRKDIMYAAGAVGKKEQYVHKFVLSREGFTMLVKNENLPSGAQVNPLSKLGDPEKAMYYAELPTEKPDVYICKLDYEEVREASNSGKKKRFLKQVVRVKNSISDDSIVVENKGDVYRTEFKVYQVTHLYCAPCAEKSFPDYKFPEGQESKLFTPLWVLGTQRELFKIHYKLIPSPITPQKESMIVRSLAMPSNFHDGAFIHDLLDSVKTSVGGSNHPGLVAHFKLLEPGALLYKVTQVTPILSLTKPNLDSNKELRNLMCNTFRDEMDPKSREKEIKNWVYCVSGVALFKSPAGRSKGAKRDKSSTEERQVMMNAFIDLKLVTTVMKPNQKQPTLDLAAFLHHLRNNLKREPEGRLRADHLPNCMLVDSNLIGFKSVLSGVCKEKTACYIEKIKTLDNICTDSCSYKSMENPDDLKKIEQHMQAGHGNREVDAIILGAAQGVQQTILRLHAEFHVSGVKVDFCNLLCDPKKANLLQLIAVIKSKNPNDLYDTIVCYDKTTGKWNLHKFVTTLACAVILAPNELCSGKIFDKVLENVGDNFEFTVEEEDPENFMQKDTTGKNAVSELIVAVIGTTLWTVSRLLSSHGPDVVRIQHNNPVLPLPAYIQFVCGEGNFSPSLAKQSRTPCSFNPGVVLFYLGTNSVPDVENTELFAIANGLVNFVQKNSTYKCKAMAAKGSKGPPELPNVFKNFEYQCFEELKFTEEFQVNLDHFKSLGCCTFFEEDAEEGDDEGSSKEDDGDSTAAGAAADGTGADAGAGAGA